MTEGRRHNTTTTSSATHHPADQGAPAGSMKLSMHDGVEVWCDCCSCEAEPYWTEAIAQLEETPQSKEDRTSSS